MEKELSTTTKSSIRRRVILFLAFVSSEECRQACGRFISAEELAFELCRLWFNEIYVPGMRYLTGFKADRSEEEVARFWACFSGDERACLERFHRFLELRIDMLPEEARRRSVFPQNDLWESVTRDAAHLLEEFESDPEPLQRQLFWIIKAALQTRD